MNRASSFLATSTLGIAVLFLIQAPPRWTKDSVTVQRELDAAFRDGQFQAELDVRTGRKPHIASGRWNSDRDRALFAEGYKQGYRSFTAGYLGRVAGPEPAAVTGYQDGLLDGTSQREAMKPFAVNRTRKYLNAGVESAQSTLVSESYKRDYRLAYTNGYQTGYYSLHEGGN